MKTIDPIIKPLLLLLVIILGSGCGESPNQSQQPTSDQKIQLRVTLDQQMQKNNPNRFEKLADIASVKLDVLNNGSFVYQDKPLTKTGDQWRIALNLDPSLGSYTFTASAYSATSLTPLYTGSITQGISPYQTINLRLGSTEPLVLTRLPFVKTVTQMHHLSSIDLNFTIVNYQRDDLHFTLAPSSIPTNCANPFNPPAGLLSFAGVATQIELMTQLTPDTNLSCQTNQYTLAMVNSRNDKVISPFTVNNNGVQLNLPPEIQRIIVEDYNTSFKLLAEVIDPDGPAPLHYQWTKKEGNVSIVGATDTQNPLLLDNYTGVGRIVLELNVSDDGGASSHIDYILRGDSNQTNTNQKLIQTGQKISYYIPFDDGHYQKGKPRSFSKDVTTEIVTDTAQNLMWEDDSTLESRILNWSDANNTCATMTLGGYSDWRLPTIKELVNLSDKSQYQPTLPSTFQHTGLQNANARNAEAWYWSASPEYYNPTTKAWIMFEDTGHIAWSSTANPQYVRCVRTIN